MDSQDFVCPCCWAADLSFDDDKIACARCGASFARRDGIFYFVVPDASWAPVLQDTVALLVDYKRNMDAAQERHGFALRQKIDDYAEPFVRHRDQTIADLLDRLSLSPESKILEVGAGDLRTASFLYGRGYRKLVCVEPAPEFLKRDAFEHCGKIVKVCCSASRLPFPDDAFDAAMVQAALHHMSDIGGALREMIRVVKKGGLLILVNEPVSPIWSSLEKTKKYFSDEAYNIGANENLPKFREYFLPLAFRTAQMRGFVDRDAVRPPHKLGSFFRLANKALLKRSDQPLGALRLALGLAFNHADVTLTAKKVRAVAKPPPLTSADFCFDPETYIGLRYRKSLVDAWIGALEKAGERLPSRIIPGQNDFAALRRGFVRVFQDGRERRMLMACGGFLLDTRGKAGLTFQTRVPEFLSLEQQSVRVFQNDELLGEAGIATGGAWTRLSFPLKPRQTSDIFLEADQTEIFAGSMVSLELGAIEAASSEYLI
jgi:SAM-dependent methyltransferase